MASLLPHDVDVRARYIFSVDGTVFVEPLENATLRIRDGVAVVDRESQSPDIDLGNVAIIPELVNAHTHLEFSSLVAPFSREPDDTFEDWIASVIRWRNQRDASDPEAHLACVEQGLTESAQCGVGMIGEIATQNPWPLANIKQNDRGSTPPATQDPRGIRFLELIGLGTQRIDHLVEQAEQYLATEPPSNWRAGLSPHAPYTVGWRLLESVVELSRRFSAPVAMHLAETLEELEFLSSHCGPLVDLLKQRNVWDPSAVPRGIQPKDYLETLSKSHRALIVHGNYLQRSDWTFLADHAANMSVVYCPRTHHYFGHHNYPLEKMLAAGVHVAVGTDSRASNPDLDLFEELRFIRQQHPQVAAHDILKLGTENGAKALGLRTRGLRTVVLPDAEAQDPFSLLFQTV